jgi:tRNA A-37 threonylcarbamoyl transferase component Bud32
MDGDREDRIYELQQALADMVPSEWPSYLDMACGQDAALRVEVLRRQQALAESADQCPQPTVFSASAESGLALAPDNSQHFRDIQSHPLSGGRFERRRRLGAGGFGIVYEAFDRQDGRDIALKTLHYFDANDVYRLKREFRSLSDVRHPNLVRLHDLFLFDQACFFTMELVRGRDFLEAMLPLIERRDLPRVLYVLRQLAEGVHALHVAGKLHGDLKPSNVLVTEDDRVKILDFGIASELGGTAGSTRSEIAGTPLYMAPESMRKGAASEASDWFSVGVMLYEALAGRPPFQGNTWELLRSKIDACRPDAAPLADSFVPELARLALELLDPEPAARPTIRRIRATFGENTTAAGPDQPARALVFAGRQTELRLLNDELRQVRSGAVSMVCIQGTSGIGKSALVRRFIADLRDQKRAIVLSGRCYERETVPYKALDGAIDVLSHHLKQLPASDLGAVLPRHFASLTRMFPVLGRIAPRMVATTTPEALLNPQDERRRAFAALRELFARLSDICPIVFVVDDAQWGDRDSAALIAEILRPPDVPRVLLLLMYRCEELTNSSFVPALLTEVRGSDAVIRQTALRLEELDAADARDLASRLVAGAPTVAEAVATESAGNPFLIGMLANSIASGAEWDFTRAISLHAVVMRVIEVLPPEARRLLEVLSIAACPLEPGVACAVADVTAGCSAAAETLRAADTVKTVRRAAGTFLETFHDRIREIVAASVPVDRRVDLHRQLAFVLESSGSGDAEAIASHYRAAGDLTSARTHSLRAAEEAMRSFAFDRAVRLFRDALESPEAADGRQVQIKLGEALASAGRGAEAADAYMTAAATSTEELRIELLRRAAEQLLISGNIERGLAAVRTVLRELHLPLARSSSGALASLLFRRALVALRGLRFKEQSESSLSERDRMLIDTCWSVAIGLSMVDIIRGADFQARHLLLALRSGEPFRIARALALELGHRGLAGSRVESKVAPLVDLARKVSAERCHPYPVALVDMTAGALAWHNGRWRISLERSDQAERSFLESCGAPPWETATARIFSLAALLWMGELNEHRRRLPPLVREARERGNLYAQVSIPLLGYGHVTTLADDEPEAALDAVQKLDAAWMTRRFDLQRFWAMYARAEIRLYNRDGRRAWEEVSAASGDVRRSLLLRGQTIRVSWTSLTARCALAAAGQGQPHLVSHAEKAAGRLEKEGVAWALPLVASIRAAVAAHRGQTSAAVNFLKQAESGFFGTEMKLHAATAVHARASLTGEPSDTCISDGIFEPAGVVSPSSLVATLTPGPW